MANDLKSELEQRIKKNGGTAIWQWYLSEAVFWISVATSMLAAMATPILGFEPATTSAIAAVPAFVLLVGERAAFLPRANWHFEYESKLNALIRELRDEGVSPAEVSARLSALELDMAGRFPGRSDTSSGATGKGG